jgi:hypothetical protein
MKTRHPLLVKWFAAARASGKDYKTLRGLVRFARAELAKPSCESEWKPRWKARCFSDEERQIRRALNDKKYRTELVARLRAEHKQRMKMPKDMAAACAKLEFFLDEKKSNDSRYNTAQRILKQVGARCLDSLTKNLTKLDISARTAEMLGVKIVRRGKDWGVYPSLCILEKRKAAQV